MQLTDTHAAIPLSRMVAALTPKRYASGRRFTFRRNLSRGWVFGVQFGPGAGYCQWNDDRSRVLVYGRSFFLSHRSGSLQWAKRHRGGQTVGRSFFGWEVGITRNSNRVPWASR